MATTTATITLSSADLLSDALSVSATQTLYKAGTTTGLDGIQYEKLEVPTGDVYDMIDATALGANKANKVYVANKATDPTHYIDVYIAALAIGRLYAGDWMFIPWSQADAAANLEVKAPNEVNAIEYALFHEGRTFTGA